METCFILVLQWGSTNKVSFLLCSVSLEVKGYLTLRCSLKLSPRMHSIRASFCPLLSLEKGEYIGMVLCFIEFF